MGGPRARGGGVIPVRGPVLALGTATLLAAGALGALVLLRAPAGGGPAAVGGSFELEAADGSAFTDRNLQGRPFLIFFGFASCPDVCPAQLATVARALEELGTAAEGVEAVFVTLDPERDSPGTADAYARSFHPGIRGLGGTRAQVDRAARAWRVYHRQVELEDSALGYTIDHSAILFLMGADGSYVRHFTSVDPAEAIADAVRGELGRES